MKNNDPRQNYANLHSYIRLLMNVKNLYSEFSVKIIIKVQKHFQNKITHMDD